MRVAILAVLAATMMSPMAAQASDAVAQTVLAAPRARVESADYRVNGRLVKVDETGTRTSYPITIKAHWFPGVLRILFDVGPASEMGDAPSASPSVPVHILLAMRPNGKNSIQIVHPGDKEALALPFEKWGDGLLGTNFSYEDLLQSEYFWAGQTSLGEAKFGARDCDILKSTPSAAEASHYTEVKSWLDHGIGFPVYVEKTLKDGAVKEFTYFGLRQTDGVWSATQIEAKMRGHAGSTLLIIDRGTPKAKLGLKDFSPEQLMHF
jgi:hypothetical protein